MIPYVIVDRPPCMYRFRIVCYILTIQREYEIKDVVHTVGGNIEFKIEQHPDGSWTAESANIDGIITGGISTKELSSALKDAVFTYFRIPPYLCNDAVLRADNEPVTVMQRVYV